MRILHLCLACFYIDNSTYQENLLPKFHFDLGNEVYIIAGPKNQKDGHFFYESEGRTYTNEHGIIVKRLELNGNNFIARKLCWYKGLGKSLEEVQPELIFIHGLQSVSVSAVIKYIKRHPSTKLFVDNHVDFMNSAKNIFSRIFLHKILWKHYAKILNKYTKMFYGVLPARVDFLNNVYDLPKDKTDLLVLGVDDYLLDKVIKNESRERIRKQFSIPDSTMLIVTGGKINSYRPETLLLMRAVTNIDRKDIQLIFFGNVSDEYKDEFADLCSDSHIHNAGWLNSEQIYELFQAGDLISFPGLHSVLWEQAIGSGKACIFRKMMGFTHVDLGGNCVFFDNLDVDSIKNQLIKMVDSGKIVEMTRVAEDKGKKYFSYKEIAKRCIKD